MERGRVAETETMPRLVVGYTELGCGRLKKGKGFLKPNFELGPNPIFANSSPNLPDTTCLFADGDMAVVAVICSCTNTGSSYTRGE